MVQRHPTRVCTQTNVNQGRDKTTPLSPHSSAPSQTIIKSRAQYCGSISLGNWDRFFLTWNVSAEASTHSQKVNWLSHLFPVQFVSRSQRFARLQRINNSIAGSHHIHSSYWSIGWTAQVTKVCEAISHKRKLRGLPCSWFKQPAGICEFCQQWKSYR